MSQLQKVWAMVSVSVLFTMIMAIGQIIVYNFYQYPAHIIFGVLFFALFIVGVLAASAAIGDK